MNTYTLLDIAIEIDGKGERATKQKLYRTAKKLESDNVIQPKEENSKLLYSEEQKEVILEHFYKLTSSKRNQMRAEEEQQRDTEERAELARTLADKEKQIEILQERIKGLESQIDALQKHAEVQRETIERLSRSLIAEQTLTLQSTQALQNITKHRTLAQRIKGLFIADKHETDIHIAK